MRAEQLLNWCTDHCSKGSLFGNHVDQSNESFDDLTASQRIWRADNGLEDAIDPLRKFGVATVIGDPGSIRREIKRS